VLTTGKTFSVKKISGVLVNRRILAGMRKPVCGSFPDRQTNASPEKSKVVNSAHLLMPWMHSWYRLLLLPWLTQATLLVH